MAFRLDRDYLRVGATLTSSVKPTRNRYTIKYISNLEEVSYQYTIKYESEGRVESINSYYISYTSQYGDLINSYYIRYHSGRELVEYANHYNIKYQSNYTDSVSTLYSLKYTTTSPNTLSFRTVYKVRFSSAGSDEVTQTYAMKFTQEFFKDRSAEYYIRYSTDTPYMFETNAVLLRNESKTSVLFFLQGRTEFLDDMLLVFSNLPKYQLVEFSTTLRRPHITILEPDDLAEYNLFGENFLNTLDSKYTPCAYILVEDVEELNALSLDVYEKTSLEKRNINKSFFFNLDSTEFYGNSVTVQDETYNVVNYSSNYYNYNYLNFIEKSLTPIFKVFDNCCFNVKITDTTSGGNCSPF